MAVFTGYFALGTGVSNMSQFQECGTYTRPAVAFTGTALSGLTQAVAQITGPTTPVGGIITKGAIFDSLTGGNCLCYWDWIVTTAVPANFLAVTVNLVFNMYLQNALNMALVGGQGTTGSLIDAGAQIGTVNGNPLIAATRLGISAGGNLVPHLGSGQWVGAMDVQGPLNINSLASGNILNNITALAGGANSALTPVLSGFINKVTVSATLNDSVILGGPSVYPGGTIVMVTNAGAAGAAVFPDTGAAINSLSANTALVVGNGKSAMFVRAGSLNWFAILSA